jgi:MarR family transcriptional regulator, organic hydroperoxide resistance regulator
MLTSEDSSTPYPLGSALEFLRSLWQLNQAIEQLSSRMEKRLGVTAQQRLLLRCIGKYPGIAAGQLAAIMHVDPGTISAALKRLETKSLIERRTDPRDQRRICLGLTPNGRALDMPTQGTVEDAVVRLFEQVPAPNVALTVNVLGQFAELLSAELQNPGVTLPGEAPPAPARVRRSRPRRPKR